MFVLTWIRATGAYFQLACGFSYSSSRNLLNSSTHSSSSSARDLWFFCIGTTTLLSCSSAGILTRTNPLQDCSSLPWTIQFMRLCISTIIWWLNASNRRGSNQVRDLSPPYPFPVDLQMGLLRAHTPPAKVLIAWNTHTQTHNTKQHNTTQPSSQSRKSRKW